MKILKHVRPLLLAIGLAASSIGKAQVTVPTNNSGGTDYVGCDNTSPFPLRIMHNDNWPIDWYTNAIQRMRLNPNVSSAMGPLNQFPNVNRDGFLLLSGQPNTFTNANSRAPFTRLHLIDAVGAVDPITYAQELGFRPWQRNGITFTGNSDQSYIGHRYAGDDNTDLVIQWSDNPNGSPWGVDRMKFVFTTEFNAGATRGAATTNGLEAIRLWPRNNLEVNVGIGDYAQPGAGDPTERVDMLDGRLRIRQLPDDPPANYLTKVLVVEDFPMFPWERGVVKWRDISTIIPPAAADCDWVLQSDIDPSFDPHVSSVYAGSSCVWGMAHGVGVGLQVPKAKFHVYHDEFSLLGRIGAWSRIVANDM
ncbi:MAG: hypothetical protein ACK46C_16075 [Flavobacteriales bacterium]